MQDAHDIRVTCHHPGMQEMIPVDRVFGSKLLKQRIGIDQDFRVEQPIKAQDRFRFACLERFI